MRSRGRCAPAQESECYETSGRSEERRVGKESICSTTDCIIKIRRHTRLVSDWSSDVCSSDLKETAKWKASAAGNPEHAVQRSQNRKCHQGAEASPVLRLSR